MKRYSRTAILALLGLWTLSAHAEMMWRSTPEVAATTGGAAGHGRARGGAALYVRDGADAVLSMWTPGLDQTVLAPAAPDGKVSLPRSGVDNYHLLLATRKSETNEERALRYFYMQGKPSGESPARLLAAEKATLDIIPDPLPREHWRYQTSAPARFLVLFENRPLAGKAVRLVTSNGTFMEAVTDAQGRAEFLLPEDFAHVGKGREANAPGEFMLSIAHADNARAYRTTLSADYHANPAHWQSLLGGGIALAAGFACGLVLLRRVPGEGRSA